MADVSPAPFVSAHSATYSDEVMAGMSQLQKDDMFTDFKMQVNGKSISCHKVVISAACPYFHALFSSGLKESQQGVVTMDTMDYEVLNIIIHHFYCNKVSLKWESIQTAIETCELFQLPDLKDQLAKYVLEHVSFDNCIGWWKFSEKYNLVEVGKKARYLMCTHLEQVSDSTDFKYLTLAELIDYIKNEDIVMLNQDPILMACIKWMDYEPVSRNDMMRDILKHIDIEKCTSSALISMTKKYKDLITDPSVMHMIYEAFLPKLKQAEQNQEKKVENKLIILGGMDRYDGKANSKCRVTSVMNQQWEEFAEFPSGSQAKQSPVVCLPNGFAVMCGGDGLTKNTMYNAETKAWSDLPPAPVALTNPTGLLCDGSIFLLDGGCIGNHFTDVMYHLSLATLKWQKGPKMLQKSFLPIAASMNRSIYVVQNDHVDKAKPRTLQTFSKVSDKWKFKCNLPEDAPQTLGACLVNIEKCLYLVGAHEICARYTTTTDTWTLLNRPTMNHVYGLAIVSGDRIYMCGGGWSSTIDAIEEYSTKDDKWSTCSLKLPKSLTFFTAQMVSFL